jgi:hypothetical protein
MAVLQVTIPDALKTEFEQAFSGQDIDGVVGRLLSDAVEQVRASQQARRSKAIAELLALRRQTPPVSPDEIQAAREWVRS